VAYLVEGLGEVHDEDISLFAIFPVTGYVIREFKKLGFTGTAFPDAMLGDRVAGGFRHGS